MANADISLLFGVLGDGTLSSGSGKEIKDGLENIVKLINDERLLKVKVGIDTKSGGKQSWSGQLQQKLDQISASGKFSAQISTLKLSPGAVSDFKKQLTAIVNTVGLTTGTQITISAEGIGDIKSKLKDAQEAIKKTGTDADEATRKIAEFKVQMEALSGQKSSIKKSIDSLTKTATSDDERARIAEITAQYEQWAIKIEEIRASKAAVTGEYRAQIEAEGAAIRANIENINLERAATEDATRAKKEYSKVNDECSNTEDRQSDKTKETVADLTAKNNLYKQINATLMQVRDAQRNWTAAENGKASGDYAALGDYINRLEDLRRKYMSLTPAEIRHELSGITSEFKNSSEAIRAAGENTKTFGQRIGTLAQKFSTWFSITRVIMAGVRSIRQMVRATIELDDAMTQLKIVTHTTEEAYDSYMDTISKTAMRIGSSITDLISSTTTYARLGYSLDESSVLAEFTAMLQNVGDIDVSDAQDALTAIIKAFGISVDEIESVMDKLVITGNNFPISVSQIAEGMNNASSALAAAGNTFDQSVALMTAANTTIQNAAKSSTGLRTIAARLRSTKTELDELGETMTEAEYGDLVAALTKYKVALTNVNGEFRSTYDIVADIAAIWEDLSTMEQAALANAIAGVRQQSVFYSMVEQFQEAAGAMEDMANSAGTLQKSYATNMKSTTAHINQFKAAFQSLSQTTFSTDFLNGIIDFGTGLLGIIETLMRLTEVVGGLNRILMATAGVIAIIKADVIVGALTTKLKKITGVISTLVGIVPKLVTAIPAFFKMMKQSASSTSTAISMIGKLTAALNEAGIAATTAQVAMGVFIVAVAAIALAVTTYKKLHKSTEELVESSNKLKESFREFKEQADSNIKTLDGLSDEFERLSEGVDQYGHNISLSADDYERYKEIIEQIVGISPELIEGYDRENGYLVDKNNLLERAIELQEKEYQNELRRMTATSNISTAVAGSVATYSDLKFGDALKADTSFMNAIYKLFNINERNDIPREMESGEFLARQILNALGVENVDKELEKYFNESGYWQSSQFFNDYIDRIAEDIGSGHSIILPGIDFEAAGFDSRDDFLAAVEDIKSAAIEYEDIQSELAQANKDVSDQLKLVAENNQQYADLSSNTKEIISDFVETFGVDEIAKDGWFGRKLPDEDAINRVKVQINDFIEKFTPEIQKLVDTGVSLQLGLDIDNTELSVEEYRQKVSDLLAEFENIEDEELKLHLRTFLSIDTNNEALSNDVEKAIRHAKNLLLDEFDGEIDKLPVSDVLQIYYQISEKPNSMTFDGLMKTLDSIKAKAETFTLSNLSDTISELQSAYTLVETAQKEMDSGSGLSAETVKALADAEETYLDYLYEENGVVKLNTEAWKENASAKMKGEISWIEKQISLLEEENVSLRQNIAAYRERQAAENGGSWDEEISEATDKIRENTAAIEAHQGKLAIYTSLYGNITGNFDAYSAALASFSNVASTVDTISGSFQTLANLQAEVANGFALSLEKALEFAAVYPEILNSAQMSADGQILLNEDIVNSFIQSKKAELNAQIDTRVAELESDKAVLQAKIEAAQTQLELAKSVGEGEGQIAQDVAEYRIKASNEMIRALIDNGIEEAEAYKLAAQSMSLNVEEFSRVAAEVCRDLDSNFNAAAYNAAMGIYENMELAKTDIASVAKQAHETANAIRGMANGAIAGASKIISGSGGGMLRKGIEASIASGEFNGFDFDFDFNGASLEKFVSQVELDISNYTKAIEQIDGQIALLQTLKNAPLESFRSSKSDSGSSGSDAAKEVEEYIAAIDDYREAIERLNRIQNDKSALEFQLASNDDLLKQIEIQKQLLAVYEDEQEALHTLNELRDQSIKEGANSLRQLGFKVEFDPDANLFYVENLEHLNELVADSQGKYDSMQEATNALREETEALINSLTDLNTANRENSEAWWELYRAMHEAQIAIYDNMRRERENTITLTENWMDDAIAGKDLSKVQQYASDIVACYRNMQETIHQQAEYYRSQGLSDTSDAVSELSDLWWEYEANITAIKQKVVDNLIAIVDTAHDAVDEIQNVLSTLKGAADEFAGNGGFITVDTLQDIIRLGPEYMQYLEDENGLLVINEENINRVIAAKTQQLALENAMSYVERIRLALEEGSIENLNQLLFATTDATNATWGLVYANLALLDLDENQYQAALHNINTIRSIADTTVENIGKVTNAAADAAEEAAKAARKELESLRDELNEMQSAGDDIIKYVMDMLRRRIQQQIDALNDLKEAYSEIIRLKKESLKASKEENDYQKSIASKIKAMAELQAKMDALSLDDSRDAQAERASLAEQLAELQEELSEQQAGHALDATMDSLDKMEDAYHKEKDKEIEILEESISSYQKLYDMAIEYISTHWDTLYSELIAWNTEYGNVLNSEITDAWNNCLAAAERYGSFVDAMLGGIKAEIAEINAQIESIDLGSGGNHGTTTGGGSASDNVVVGGSKDYEGDYTSGYIAKISELVAQMRENSSKWHTVASAEERNRLHEDSVQKAAMISRLGVTASYDPAKGAWTIVSDKWNPSNIGKNLLFSYHTGGIAGNQPTLKQNEIMAVLEKGEAVLDAKKEKTLYRMIDFTTTLSEKFAKAIKSLDMPRLFAGMSHFSDASKETPGSVSSAQTANIQFGDVYIYGASEETVEKHRAVTREQTNAILSHLNIKR